MEGSVARLYVSNGDNMSVQQTQTTDSKPRLKFTQTKIQGVILVEPAVFKDSRGFFLETYDEEKYVQGGIRKKFVKDNRSSSVKGVLRGLHLQLKHSQGKLVSVVDGEIFDVAVDVRRGSPTFMQWVGVVLSGSNFKQIYIPPGLAHGFCVLSDNATLEYKCTDKYDPKSELGIRWSDPDICIDWPATHPVLSKKDESSLPISKLMDKLPLFNKD